MLEKGLDSHQVKKQKKLPRMEYNPTRGEVAILVVMLQKVQRTQLVCHMYMWPAYFTSFDHDFQ